MDEQEKGLEKDEAENQPGESSIASYEEEKDVEEKDDIAGSLMHKGLLRAAPTRKRHYAPMPPKKHDKSSEAENNERGKK